MAKEQEVEKDKDVSDTDAPKETSFTAAEEKARGMGHRSKEEWVAEGKDADAWVSADEFLRRAPLYEGLHKANRTVKSLEKKLNMLVQHQEELVSAKVSQQIDALKAQKKQAAKEHDVEKVVELDEQIEEVKAEAAKKKGDVKDDAKEALEGWKEKNEWYGSDEDMTAYANGIGSKLEADHKDDPDWDFDKILAEVAKKTKKAFEWKTKNPNREAAGKVAASKNGSSDTPATKGKMPTYNDLPPEAQAMYKEFVKTDKNPHGIMTKEQYLKDYAIKAGLIQEAE